jgi:hypothetical protein
VFTFLRSLFVSHGWVRQTGSNVRTCGICGEREELDIDDGASLNAWYVTKKGNREAHINQDRARPAAAIRAENSDGHTAAVASAPAPSDLF